jgi:hypothetical protein
VAISRNTKTGGGTSVNSGAVWNADDINVDMDTLFNKINSGLLNADIASGAGIVYSKLNLTGGIVNGDVSASAAVAYTKLNLAGAILNADVNASAAIAYSKLNLAASIQTSDIVAAGLNASKLDAPYPLDSGIVNGFFDWWQRSPTATGVTITSGADTYLADRWAIEPAGANCTASRVTSALHSTAVGDVGVELIGAASVTSIELTQRVSRATARRMGALLANQNVTFGAKVRHSGTTGTITPTLIVRSTSNTGDDSTNTKFAAGNMTQRVSQAFSGLAASAEASLSHTFDLGAMTDSENGFEIVLSFAAMSAATQKITVTDVFLIRGSVAPLTLVRPNESDEYDRCIRFYQKTFGYETAPAQNAGVANCILAFPDNSSNLLRHQWMHGRMRGIPTVTTYNPSAANANFRKLTAGTDYTANVSTPGSSALLIGGSGAVTVDYYQIHVAIDAEWYD